MDQDCYLILHDDANAWECDKGELKHQPHNYYSNLLGLLSCLCTSCMDDGMQMGSVLEGLEFRDCSPSQPHPRLPVHPGKRAVSVLRHFRPADRDLDFLLH